MINNWDIISRLDQQAGSFHYTLVIDGTEHDAHLIAKKLQGYVQAPTPAVDPFAFSFELPADLDEDTLEKIRTAVRETVEQSKTVNQFIPGGILGDPLFNHEKPKEENNSSFMNVDSSDPFFQPQQESSAKDSYQAPNQDTAGIGIEKHTVETPVLSTNENSDEITINDKDMLIKDMEGTLLGQMPLEDIFGAETKYDMFLDLENQQLVKNSQVQRDQKINTLADGKPNLEDSFNVFEQKIKDQTCIIDLDDLNVVTDRLSKKDLGFVEHAQPTPDPLKPTTAEQVFAEKSPEKPTVSALPDNPTPKADPNKGKDTGDAIELRVQTRPTEQEQNSVDTLTATQGTFTLSSNVEEIPDVAEATLRWKIPVPEPKSAQEQEIIMAARENLLSQGETKNPFETDLPNEVELLNTNPSIGNEPEEEILGKTFNLETTLNTGMKAQYACSVASAEEKANEEDLPPLPIIKKPIDNCPEEVLLNTVRGESTDNLDKTFNLETTLNTEMEKMVPPTAPVEPKKPVECPEEEILNTVQGQKCDELDKTFNLETTLNTGVEKMVPSTAPVEPKKPVKCPEEAILNTVQGHKCDELDKTFNLETTLNTEMKDVQPSKPAAPQISTSSPPVVSKPDLTNNQVIHPPKRKQKVLLLKGRKKEAQPQDNFTAIQREKVMEENKELNTTFRIRRKTEPATAPVPPAPAAPVSPVQKPAPVVPPTPAPADPVAPATPVESSTPAPANTTFEKTKTIDHSIEIPLSELKKHNWPLEVPLVPTYTLENMVMSVNRFAHATAISVIENPGKMYNPLVLHGSTGTGKTHFLNAMAYAFSKKYGQENIFMTNGVRLSRGIQRYVMEGNIEKFEKFMDTVKVLLMDDIHLIAINEQNRAHISSLLNRFRQQGKQIVITSKYPPESLAKLEELLRFKLDSGWISELKPAKGPAHLKIVKKMLLDSNIDLNDSQIAAFFGGQHMTLGTVTRSIRRVKVLENLIFSNLNENERTQANIFEKLLATTGEDATSDIVNKDLEDITSLATSGNGEWGRIGFFYPQNCSHMMNWMVYALEQRAKELGIQGGFEIAVRSSYATENVISSAFKIANLCDNKKLKGAVILGPQLKACDPSVRENFYDILTHMLEIMLIRCGIINFENVKAPSTYVKVISELLR